MWSLRQSSRDQKNRPIIYFHYYFPILHTIKMNSRHFKWPPEPGFEVCFHDTYPTGEPFPCKRGHLPPPPPPAPRECHLLSLFQDWPALSVGPLIYSATSNAIDSQWLPIHNTSPTSQLHSRPYPTPSLGFLTRTSNSSNIEHTICSAPNPFPLHHPLLCSNLKPGNPLQFVFVLCSPRPNSINSIT